MPYQQTFISNSTKLFIDTRTVDAIVKYSTKYRVEDALIRAIITAESAWDPWAVRYEKKLKGKAWYKRAIPKKYSKNNFAFSSIGLMQVLYGIAHHDLGYRGDPVGLMDPDKSIMYGTKHLKGLLKRYPDTKDAISAYNQGSPKRDESGKHRNAPYVFKVYREYRKCGGSQ